MKLLSSLLDNNDVAGFDIDGTLIDTTPSQHHAINALLSHYGSPMRISLNTLKELMPLDTKTRIKLFAEQYGANITDHEQAARDYVTFVNRHRHMDRIYEGTAAVLQAAQAKKKPIMLITSATHDEAKTNIEKLEQLVGGKFYKALVTFDDVSQPKPHFESILLGLYEIEKAGAKTQKFFYVGDSEHDMQLVKNANDNLPVKGTAIYLSTNKPFEKVNPQTTNIVGTHHYNTISDLIR